MVSSSVNGIRIASVLTGISKRAVQATAPILVHKGKALYMLNVEILVLIAAKTQCQTDKVQI